METLKNKLVQKLYSGNFWRDIIFVILLGVIVVSPYYRGLFFREDAYNFQLYVTLILVALLLVSWAEKFLPALERFNRITHADDDSKVAILKKVESAKSTKNKGSTATGSTSLLTNRPFDFIIWGLPVIYLLSTLFTAVDAGLSRDILLRNVSYATVYSILIMTMRTRRHQYLAVNAIVLAGLWVSIYGLGIIYGSWEFADGILSINRLSSVFQYPNTLAAFAGGVFFTAIIMGLRPYLINSSSENKKNSFINYIFSSGMTAIYTAIAAIMIGVIFLTQSRAALVVWLIVFVLGLIFTPLRDKLSYLVTTGIALVAGVYLMTQTNPLYRVLYDHNRSPEEFPPVEGGWEILLTAVVLSLIAGLIYGLIHHLGQHGRKFLLASQVVTTTLLVVAFVILLPMAADFVADNEDLFATTMKRMATILEVDSQTSFTARNIFVQDGLRMYQDYPILGAGGGAWEVLFESYQEYSYWSTQAHIYYVQLMTETGTLGALILASILLVFIACLLYLYIHNRQTGQREHNYLFLAVFLMAMMMLGHSAADFNMSYSFFAVVVWIGLALVFARVNFWNNNPENLSNKSNVIDKTGNTVMGGRNKFYKTLEKVFSFLNRGLVPANIKLSLMSLVALVLLVTNLMPVMAINNMTKANLAIQEGRANSADRAYRFYELAYGQDKLDYRTVIDFSHFTARYLQLQPEGGRRDMLEGQAIKSLTNLSQARPLNIRIRQDLVTNYSRLGYVENAIEETEEIIALSPYNDSFHSNLIVLNYSMVEHGLINEDIDQAREYLDKALQAHEGFTIAQQANADNKPEGYWNTFVMTNTAAHKLGIAYYLVGNYEEAVTQLTQGIRDQEGKEDATCWLAAAYYKLDDEENFAKQVQAAIQLNETNGEKIEAFIEIDPLM